MNFKLSNKKFDKNYFFLLPIKTSISGTYVPGLSLMFVQLHLFKPLAPYSLIIAASLDSEFLTCFVYGVSDESVHSLQGKSSYHAHLYSRFLPSIVLNHNRASILNISKNSGQMQLILS